MGTFIFLVLAIPCYFLPWIIALSSKHPRALAIGLLNLFFGWSMLGWGVALIWAVCKPAPQRPPIIIYRAYPGEPREKNVTPKEDRRRMGI